MRQKKKIKGGATQQTRRRTQDFHVTNLICKPGIFTALDFSVQDGEFNEIHHELLHKSRAFRARREIPSLYLLFLYEAISSFLLMIQIYRIL